MVPSRRHPAPDVDRARTGRQLASAADGVRARDAALRRISHTRRWVLAGAAALSAALAALASALLPGRSFGARSLTGGVRAAGSIDQTPPLPAAADAAQLGLSASAQASGASPPQPAPQPPTPAPQPAPAPSGGSGEVVSGGS